MKEAELVSIILPTRNRANSIPKTIDSVRRQSYANWELVIVDGDSSDDTPQVARSYMAKEPRISYHRSFPRQGLPRDRNIGISLTRGDLIYFIEDDVVIEPDCLEILVRTFNELKARGIRVGGVSPRSIEPEKEGKLMLVERQVAERRRQNMKVPALIDKWTGLMFQNFGINSKEVLPTPLVPSWSLFAREALQLVGGFEEKAYARYNYSHEETDFQYRLGKHGYRLFFQPKAVSYHNHGASGGTRVSAYRYYYAFLFAHLVFMKRNFGWKACYTIPFSLIYMGGNGLRISGMLALREVCRKCLNKG